MGGKQSFADKVSQLSLSVFDFDRNHIDKLNDDRLICCDKNLLIIYKKINLLYHIQLSIKEHRSIINSFTILNDGRIITCSEDNTMKIFKLIEEDKYQIEQTLKVKYAYKIIEIEKNKLISISYNGIMQIWILNNENKFENITNIYFQNTNSSCNIIKLNKNEFVTSSYDDLYIKFWNSNNYSIITTINNIHSSWTKKNMCLLENDILCVGGTHSKGFYLIKISTHQLIKNIGGTDTIYYINKCLDGLFLCSFSYRNRNYLVKYKYKEQNFKKIKEKKFEFKYLINSFVELNDKSIAYLDYNNNLSFWES